jgi:hypothetical protein
MDYMSRPVVSPSSASMTRGRGGDDFSAAVLAGVATSVFVICGGRFVQDLRVSLLTKIRVYDTLKSQGEIELSRREESVDPRGLLNQ